MFSSPMKHTFIPNKEIVREKVERKKNQQHQKAMRVKLSFLKANDTSDLN